MSRPQCDVDEELVLMEQAEVLIDGIADTPASRDAQHDDSEDEPSLREVSYPITPIDVDDDQQRIVEPQPWASEAAGDAVKATLLPIATDRQGDAHVPKREVSASGAPLSTEASRERFATRKPKRNAARLYTPPPNALSPNYGRVLNFSEEEAREKQRNEQRASASRGSNGAVTRGGSQQRPAQPLARRVPRLEDSVPRGPAPNYGTVLRFDDDVTRGGAAPAAKPHSCSASLNTTTASFAKTNTPATTTPTATSHHYGSDKRTAENPFASQEEQAKHVDRLSRPRQAYESSPPPNFLDAHKQHTRTSSLSRTNQLAEPRKREVRREEDVISAPPHAHRASSSTRPINQESVNRLSQPRQRRASLSHDPLLSQAREQAKRSSYGGTTPISLPSKAQSATADESTSSGTPVRGKSTAPPVSWADMKPAPRPTSSLAGRVLQRASPCGARQGTAPRFTPPLTKPTGEPIKAVAATHASTMTTAQGAKPAAPSVVVSQAAAARADTKDETAEEMPAPPVAVRAKRRVDPEVVNGLGGTWQPLGDISPPPARRSATAATGSTCAATPPSQSAVVYAAKRKSAASATPCPAEAPHGAAADLPAGDAHTAPAATESAPVLVTVKKRPPPKTATGSGTAAY